MLGERNETGMRADHDQLAFAQQLAAVYDEIILRSIPLSADAFLPVKDFLFFFCDDP